MITGIDKNKMSRLLTGSQEESGTDMEKIASGLGEELIAICVHILSHMVGIKDGKLCVRTDDKGASGKIVVMGTTAFDLSVGDSGR